MWHVYSKAANIIDLNNFSVCYPVAVGFKSYVFTVGNFDKCNERLYEIKVQLIVFVLNKITEFNSI